MQNLCRQINLATIDEIVALIALYRPGPMDWIPTTSGAKTNRTPLPIPTPCSRMSAAKPMA